MTSDEEREFFESHGWEYNFVKRHWLAPKRTPDGEEATISQDELVRFTSSGPGAEMELRNLVVMLGSRS